MSTSNHYVFYVSESLGRALAELGRSAQAREGMQTHRHTAWIEWTERQTDRHMDRMDTQTDSMDRMDRKTDGQTYGQNGHTDRQYG